MSFAAPLLLLAVLVVAAAAALYAWFERRGRTGRAAFATPALMPAVAPRHAGWRRHLGPALYVLAALALVVALARPQRSVAVPVEQASVMLVTDRSGSMRAEDVQPTRMDAAKRAAGEFLSDVPRQIRVGAIGFNHRVRLLASPTTDRDRVRRATDALTGLGSTAAGDALAAALRILRPAGGTRDDVPSAIILLSDGETVRGQDPVAVAREAREKDVRIFTIALGTDAGTLTSRAPDGSLRTENVPPDRDALRQIAEASGGEYSDAPSAEALRAVYAQLGSKLATEPGEQELTSAGAGLALVLLVLGAGLSLRLTGRLV
ncbi:VWA domain-containing protein [Patulibacter sp. S7RM1-6]